MAWRHQLETKAFGKLPTQGERASASLRSAASQITEELEEVIRSSHKEAEQIFKIAKELQGDPWRSSAYMEAVTLNSQAHKMYELIQGHYTFDLPASAAPPPKGAEG